MQVLHAVDFTKNYIPSLDFSVTEGCNGNQLATIDLASHAVAPRAKLYGFVALQLCDIFCGPPHVPVLNRCPHLHTIPHWTRTLGLSWTFVSRIEYPNKGKIEFMLRT